MTVVEFTGDRVMVTATYEHGGIVELTIRAVADRIKAVDLRGINLSELDKSGVPVDLVLPPYDGSEEWRHAFADRYAVACAAFRNPGVRIAQANGWTVATVYNRIREGRLRGDIPWSDAPWSEPT